MKRNNQQQSRKQAQRKRSKETRKAKVELQKEIYESGMNFKRKQEKDRLRNSPFGKPVPMYERRITEAAIERLLGVNENPGAYILRNDPFGRFLK